MRIFGLELLKQQSKNPSSSQLPNFNLQMSFCLLSGTGSALNVLFGAESLVGLWQS